jgi:hypothetical protein
VEKDESGNGRVDMKMEYRDGRPLRSLRDEDQDGRFETTIRFDRTPWTSVVEKDADGDGRAESTSYFKDEQIQARETDIDGDGRIDLKEQFDSSGTLVSAREREKGADGFEPGLDLRCRRPALPAGKGRRRRRTAGYVV